MVPAVGHELDDHNVFKIHLKSPESGVIRVLSLLYVQNLCVLKEEWRTLVHWRSPEIVCQLKIDGVGPIDNSPSMAKAPQIGKIHPFNKIAVTLEPVMQFQCPLKFRIS